MILGLQRLNFLLSPFYPCKFSGAQRGHPWSVLGLNEGSSKSSENGAERAVSRRLFARLS